MIKHLKKLDNILKNIRNGTITSLKLSDDEIRQEAAIEFAKALAQNETIKTLELCYNEIQQETAIEFAKALAQNKNYQNSKAHKKSFLGNGRYRGAVLLAKALKKNSTITHVDLGGFFIGDEGAIALAEALEVNSTITFLNLSKNNIYAQESKIGRSLGKESEYQIFESLWQYWTFRSKKIGPSLEKEFDSL